MSTIRLRPQSEVGYLMLQWLAVLVLGHAEIERRERFKRFAARPPSDALVAELARRGLAVTHTQPPPREGETVISRARRLVALLDESYARHK